MTKLWNFVSLPELYYRDEGYSSYFFSIKEDRVALMVKGPYTIYNMPMSLNEWAPDFELKGDLLKVMPIWVTFPHFPLNYWRENSLGNIASAIGKSVVTDECTARKLRVYYARVLIEVDITQKCREHVVIKDTHGRRRVQAVSYNWKPLFCIKCQLIGHDCAVKAKPAGVPTKPPAKRPVKH